MNWSKARSKCLNTSGLSGFAGGCRAAPSEVVLAMGPGNLPAVGVWTRKTVRFGSRPRQNPDPQPLHGPNPYPYPSTRGFCRVWLDPSGTISGSRCRVFYLWSESDMLLLCAKYQLWCTILFICLIGCLNNQNEERHAHCYILKLSVNNFSSCIISKI